MDPDANVEIVTAERMPDPLTGPSDRRLLVERLTQSIERARQYPGFHFAVLCVDLVRPGPSAAGADAADPVLAAAGRRLEASVRLREKPPTLRHNDVVATLGGDRFAILLDGLKDVGDATVVADRILAEMAAPFPSCGDARLTASVGVAVSATGYAHADDVLRDAAAAVRRATLLGGSRCEVFDAAVLKIAQAELRLEGDFAGALEREEFFLLYQPIVALASNRLVGFEALVRWQHPVLGLIGPLEFVPLAERTGFIIPLGRWVLEQACRQLKDWEASAPAAAVWMSVNLSSVQFKRSTLVDDITATLRETGVDPRRLILELTESIAMEDPQAVRVSLVQLRAIGVRVSLDDFGTGHSSLAYLRQFPLDSLKVDRSFVRGIEDNGDMTSIVNAVKSMAHQLGLRVVAEGIEKDEQVALLRALDCEMGQGYLFSPPVAADQAAALLVADLPLRALVAAAILPALPMRTVNGRPVAKASPWRSVRRWMYAAAGLAALVLSAGIPTLLSTPRPPEVAAGVAGSPDAGRLAVNAGTVLPPVSSEPTAKPALTIPVAQSVVARQENAPAPAPVRPPAAAPALLPRAVVVPPPAAVPVAPVLPRAVASLRVVHQHRLGSCRGLLVVTRDGVEYQPDAAEHQVKDGFALPYTRFLSEMSGSSLVIKSNDRDYRFKPEAPSSARDHIEQLDAAIAQLR